MGKPLHFHHLGDFDGARIADPSDVIAAQVQQHDVLGALLLAALQLRFVGVVLAGGAAARTGASDGVSGGDAVLDFDYGFDGRADDLEPVQVQVVHVGRRVDTAQGAVNLEWMGAGLARKPLRVDHLDYVAGINILDALVDGVGVAVGGEIGLYGTGRHRDALLKLLRKRERTG